MKFEQKEAHGGAAFCSPASAQRPSRLVVLPCRRWATRSAVAAHGPSPGRAALAPRRRARPSSLPAGRRPESPHLRARCSGGADLERARGGRRGGACAAARATPRARALAQPHVRGPVREVGWPPGQLGRLNSSRTRRLPSELIVRIGTALVVAWSEGVATEAQLATGASSATQAFALG